jgi:histidyl-tRNA synthetase
VLLPLAMALMELGEFSFARAQSNLSAIGSNDLKSSIGEIFGKQCPTDASLISSFNESFHLYSGRVYDKFAHEVNVLFGLVWKIVAWELVTAYAVLEAADLNEKIGNVPENGENSKVDNKKKKKAVLGKGTNSILALIKDRLQSDAENLRLLETWVADFLSFLDLAKPEFNDFLLKVNDVVESNESRRLPKIPKVILLDAFMDKINCVT